MEASAPPVIRSLAEAPEDIEEETIDAALCDLRHYGVGGPIGDKRKGVAVSFVRGVVGNLLRTVEGGLKWVGDRFIWIGGTSAGVTVAGRALVRHEKVIRDFIYEWSPQALPFFEKALAALKNAGI